MYRILKLLSYSCLLLSFIVIIGLAVFFTKNEAPFLKGELERNIAYKENLELDLYLPTQKVYDKIPVVIHFHGGAWIVGVKESINAARLNGAVNELRAAGYALVSPNYTLARKNTLPFPACIEDAFDAVNWVVENADKYNFDLNNVGLMGESAGAHLAMMVAYANAEDFDKQLTVPIDYLVNVYGPTELYELYKQQMPLIQTVKARTQFLPEFLENQFELPERLFGFNPKEDTIKAKAMASLYSPLNFIDEDEPPTFIIHGEKDRLVPFQQAILLKEKLEKQKIKYQFHAMPNTDHGFFHASKEQKSEVQNEISNFIIENYNQ